MNYHNLTLDDRRSIERLYSAGTELTEIASTLGVHLATIYRELARGTTGNIDENGREGYSAEVAQRATIENRKKCGRKRTA